MSLKEFADNVVGAGPGGPPYAAINPTLSQLRRDPATLESLLATLFWQIAVMSPAYARVLQDLNLTFTDEPQLVVAHGDPNACRYSLLTWHYNAPPTGAKALLNASDSDIRIGYRAWVRSARYTQPYSNVLALIDVTFALQAKQSREHWVLVAPSAPIERTAVPPTAWGIGHSPPTSSAGAIVTDASNRLGVTGSYHAIHMLTNVSVSGRAGTVSSQLQDPLTDSCFVEVPSLAGVPGLNTGLGPLVGTTPRGQHQAWFEGIGSNSGGRTPATVFAWTLGLGQMIPGVQEAVYTNWVTNPMDSGAALQDGTHILGFASFRSKPGYIPPFSGWIWTEQVFNILQLTAF